MEIERRLSGVAIQGTVSRWGEVSLLALDTAKEGSEGLVDPSATTDIELLAAGRPLLDARAVVEGAPSATIGQ